MRANRDIRLFDKKYSRKYFDCGNTVLNRYLQQQITQDVKRKFAVAYVYVLEDESKVIGFYTLSANAVYIGDISSSTVKKLPKYPLVPVSLLGRLAIDKVYQGQSLGDLLLMDALFVVKYQHSKSLHMLLSLVQ